MTIKTISPLSRDALERIQQTSLRILEEVGVKVADPACLELLRRAGGRIVGQTDIVRLPAELVTESLAQVTRQFDLVKPDGTRYPMPGERPRLISRVKMGSILDYGAAEARPPRRQDVIDLCRLTRGLPAVEFSYAVDYPSTDVPPALDIVDTVALMVAITGNPGVCAPVNAEAGRAWVDIAEAASPSGDLARDPTLLVAICTTGPLQLEAENGRLLRHIVGRGVPLAAEPMPMAGGSAPFTLAGALAMGNAEALFLFTLANAVRPGAKVSYSSLGTIMNMAAGNVSMGAPEAMLLSSAETALARYHGLSTYRPSCYSDSCYPDAQAGIEKAAFTLMVTLSGADLVLMGGSLNNASILSPEQVVIDHDVWELAGRCRREIEVNAETLAYETIAAVGPGGSFLDTEHTLRWLRSGEHLYGGSFNRSGQAGAAQTMLARAHARVEQSASRPLTFAAPAPTVARIRRVVDEWARDAGVAAPAWPEGC